MTDRWSLGAPVASVGPVAGTAFEPLAADYDDRFTHRPIGRVLRAAVWWRLDAVARPGDHVLDLGCGTGEDALHLARRGVHVTGIDGAPGMIRQAGAKLRSAGLAERARFEVRPIEELAATTFPRRFDGVLADFGVLNCVADLPALGRALAERVRPGGWGVAVIMGPWCAWEVAWYGLRGDAGRAFRRWRGNVTVDWGAGPLTVRYPPPDSLTAAFEPAFTCRGVRAVGALLPPAYAAAWLEARPRALAALAALERRLDHWPAAVALADHYLVQLRRQGDSP